MTDMEKADAILRMMDMHFAKFRQSRDIEFRVNIAIWTGLFILGKFFTDLKIQIVGWGWFLYIGISLVIVFCHYQFWMKPIQASQNRDSSFVRDCRGAIQTITKTSIQYPILKQRWIFFEVGFSALILIGLAIILFIK